MLHSSHVNACLKVITVLKPGRLKYLCNALTELEGFKPDSHNLFPPWWTYKDVPVSLPAVVSANESLAGVDKRPKEST